MICHTLWKIKLDIADFVIMVCTENYINKANAGEGGVGYEKMIITSSLLSHIDGNKVIPIIRQNGTTTVPTFLKSKIYLNFSNSTEFEYSFDELLRKLLATPLFQKPEIGNNPYTSIEESKPKQSSDALRDVMAVIAAIHEQLDSEYIQYKNIKQRIKLSRSLFDLMLSEAEEQKLISRIGHPYIKLEKKGLHYIVENKLV